MVFLLVLRTEPMRLAASVVAALPNRVVTPARALPAPSSHRRLLREVPPGWSCFISLMVFSFRCSIRRDEASEDDVGVRVLDGPVVEVAFIEQRTIAARMPRFPYFRPKAARCAPRS